MDNRFNEVFLSFSLFNYEFSPGNKLIDVFSNYFSFHSLNKKSDHNVKSQLLKLNSITLQALLDPYLVVIVTDASIKNQVATLILYIHIYNRPVIKIIHHTVNVMSTEAELFVIRCSINQAICLPNVKCIFVIMDSIHTTKKIFDSSSHLYQIYLATISSELREFFHKNGNNFIKFWNCSSNYKWLLHHIVDKETKKFNLTSIFSYRSFWDLSRKNECNTILNNWKMSFQVLYNKGQNFLELLDDNLKLIEPSVSKDGLWLKYFSYSNLLCTKATRVIVNHAPIDEYHLRFFSQEEFKCLCSLQPIESRHYILYKYRCFNNYWNLRRNSIVYFTLFLEFNGNAFFFNDKITQLNYKHTVVATTSHKDQ